MSDEPQFWMTMQYGCDKCDVVVTFYLEVGCEGPKDGTPLKFRMAADHPIEPNAESDWPRTASGRLVVPVPFMAMGCPECQPKPPWSMAEGVLAHVMWHRDDKLSGVFTEDELPTVYQAGRFYYPPGPIGPSKSAMDQHPCGMPVFGRHDSRVKS